jgi:uncharacterized protein YecE (DUF72 family)
VRLFVGCAQWTHKSWQGRLVAHPLPPHERLRAYAGWCNAVEGNTTFYAVPARDTVATWARQTDPTFRFVMKLPRIVTHDRCLTDVDAEMRAFLTAMEPLGPRTHAVWIQLPASFGPADLTTLARFMRRLPDDHRYAVEVRHPQFFTDPGSAARLEDILARSAAEWIPFDTVVLFAEPPTTDMERDAWTRKPRVPRRSTALTDRPIVRYIGRDDAEQTAKGWQFWADVTAAWLREGRSPTVFIHTPDNVDAPVLARRFHDDVRARVPELQSLPEPEPAEPLTLF